MASLKNLTGVATVDLGLGAGDQLKDQAENEIDERRKKALQLNQQQQMFPASSMLFGMGSTSGGML